MKKSTLAFITLALLLLAEAGSAQTTLYSQNFEGTGLPSDWSQVTNADDGGWKFGTNTQLQSSSFPISAHTKMACTNDDACNCDKSNDMLISPAMDFSGYSYIFMSFDNYYYNLSYGGATESASIKASTDGGTTWSTVTELAGNTGDWETRFVDLSAYAGQSNVKIAFAYDDGGDWLYGWAMDNMLVYAPVAGLDAGVSTFQIGKLDPTPTFTAFSKYITNLPLSVTATISNLGTVPITSFDATWTDGTNTYPETITGINIGTFESYTYTASAEYVTLPGSHNLSLTISNINGGSAELDADNNDGSFTISGVVPNPDQHYVAEEATGTWCGWCVRGIVFMDYMREAYPDQFIGIAVHNGDPMKLTAYDNWVGSFPGFQGYPSVIINRNYIVDPSELEGDFINSISNAPAVKVTVDPVYNSTTKELTATLTGDFLQNLSGDYRFVAVLREDSVHGTSGTYAQTNYYSIADYGYAGPMQGYENQPGHIPAAQMYYDFVGRALLSSVDGTAGSLPGTLNSGSSYSYEFTYTVPAAYNVNRLKVVGMVVDYSTGEVLNAGINGLKFTTGIDNQPVSGSVFLYPNPANQAAYLDLKITQPADVTYQVVNLLGQVVADEHMGTLSGSQLVPVDVSHLPTGIYQVKVTIGDQLLTQKLEVVR
ncbi:MAG: T9SS type A sorting domain-containing protein [Chitinophagales bacterium]|nr:T9SS type A sorting domain-containing protein [Chitinophagales bacterium]